MTSAVTVDTPGLSAVPVHDARGVAARFIEA
jgi:hypothetical protein